jgi:hypothetical protein
MPSPLTVFKQWTAFQRQQHDLPPKDRHKARQMSKIAKDYAKRCGMKSMGEVRCAADLQKRRIPFSYENATFKYQYKPQRYTPDFELYPDKGEKIYIEYKGKMDPATRKKLLAIRSCNPDVTLHMVFEKANNKIRKGSKTTYAMWAEKNGFEWSEHYIKEEWIK